jgi:hypothetical protein
MLLIFPSCVYGQLHNDSIISLHLSSSSDYNRDFYIDIIKKGKAYKIVYTFQNVGPAYDIYFEKYMERFNKTNNQDSIKMLRLEKDSVRKSCSFYSKDSIHFESESYKDCSLFFDQVFGAQECDMKPPSPYVVLDGGRYVSFKVITRNRVIKMYGTSPDEKYYPFLYKLIEEALTMGRNAGLQKFLAKEKTFWY